jgi:hypothetical protein
MLQNFVQNGQVANVSQALEALESDRGIFIPTTAKIQVSLMTDLNFMNRNFSIRLRVKRINNTSSELFGASAANHLSVLYNASGWAILIGDGSTNQLIQLPNMTANSKINVVEDIVITVDRSGQNVKGYLNGVLMDSVTISLAMSVIMSASGAITVSLGQAFYSYFSGYIYRCKLYTTLLTQEDVIKTMWGKELYEITEGAWLPVATTDSNTFTATVGSWAALGSGTITQSAGVANCTAVLTGGKWPSCKLPAVLTVGKRYQLTMTVTNLTGGSLYVASASDGTAYKLIASSNGTVNVEFVALHADLMLCMSAAGSFTMDNVYIGTAALYEDLYFDNTMFNIINKQLSSVPCAYLSSGSYVPITKYPNKVIRYFTNSSGNVQIGPNNFMGATAGSIRSIRAVLRYGTAPNVTVGSTVGGTEYVNSTALVMNQVVCLVLNRKVDYPGTTGVLSINSSTVATIEWFIELEIV